MDDIDYLQPGFDPASLTVPRLRSLLVEYDVAWPSSAKKAQLVDLFNEHIAPRAQKILNARARTQRSSRGITTVSTQKYEDYNDDDEAESNREPTPAARRSDRHSRAVTEESTASAAPSVASRASRSTRRSSARISEAPEPEAEATPRATSRRGRKSTATPAPIKEESPLADEESPFTQENPFQSGSSPLFDAQSERRRRTTGHGTTTAENTRTSTSRRKTTDMTPSASIPASRKSEIFEVALRKHSNHDDEDGDEEDEIAGEEFTPEEELELKEEEEQGKAVLPLRKTTKTRSSAAFKIAPLAILLAISGGVFTKWREEKLAVGYCGIGRPSISLAGIDVPQWAEFILPECEPCPLHAYCHRDLETACEPDFLLRPHPLSLGGLVPLAPTCEPDGEKARKVQAVADRAVEELRQRNAKFECGELKDAEGSKRHAKPEIQEEELKQAVASRRRKGMSQHEFEDLWSSAIGEVSNREEIEANRTSGTLRSKSLARISFSCAVRRSLRLTLAKYIRQLVLILVALGAALYGYISLLSSRATELRAKHLASFAFKRLSTQAALYAEQRVSEPYISVGQLRDDILREEFSRRRREKLWRRVVVKVENNSNVRPRVTETRTGEVTRVWEWIGAIERVEYTPATQDSRPIY